MRSLTVTLAAGALFIGAAALAYADHHGKAHDHDAQDTAQAGAEMPPVGPPAEMNQLAAMNGTFAVKFHYKMDPTKEEWTETDATAVLSLVAGGGAQQLLFEGNMMGMPLKGLGLTSYDRETKKWQTTWVDNMGARISMYTGDFKDGRIVQTGEDMSQGMTFLSRMTTYNITDTGFEWKYEMSMDGTNYLETAKAVYTKQ